MPQFTLNWNNIPVMANPNSLSQTVSYKKKYVANSTVLDSGVYITAGFTPANPLLTSASTALSPNLLANVIYLFKVEANCTGSMVSANNNGVLEVMKFACIAPVVTKTNTTSNIQIPVTNTDITKARFTLRKTSDNSMVNAPIIVDRAGATDIATVMSGLAPDTDYYWQVELYATVKGVEVISSSSVYLNAVCGPYSFTTDGTTSCVSPGTLTVS